MKDSKNSVNEVIDINGSRIIVQNDQVKSILNENIRKTGYMTVEEAKLLTIEKIRKIYQLSNAL